MKSFMRAFMFSGLVVALVCGVGPAFADAPSVPFKVGMFFDVSVPSGAVCPFEQVDWRY